jgi:hypothetical protein
VKSGGLWLSLAAFLWLRVRRPEQLVQVRPEAFRDSIQRAGRGIDPTVDDLAQLLTVHSDLLSKLGNGELFEQQGFTQIVVEDGHGRILHGHGSQVNVDEANLLRDDGRGGKFKCCEGVHLMVVSSAEKMSSDEPACDKTRPTYEAIHSMRDWRTFLLEPENELPPWQTFRLFAGALIEDAYVLRRNS